MLLVTPSTAAMVAEGDLPPAWSAALGLAREAVARSSIRPAPTCGRSRSWPRTAPWCSCGSPRGWRPWPMRPDVAPRGSIRRRLPEPTPALHPWRPRGRHIRAKGPATVTPGGRARPIRCSSRRSPARSTPTGCSPTSIRSPPACARATPRRPSSTTRASTPSAIFQSLGISASLDPFTGAGHPMTNVVAVKTGHRLPVRSRHHQRPPRLDVAESQHAGTRRGGQRLGRGRRDRGGAAARQHLRASARSTSSSSRERSRACSGASTMLPRPTTRTWISAPTSPWT